MNVIYGPPAECNTWGRAECNTLLHSACTRGRLGSGSGSNPLHHGTSPFSFAYMQPRVEHAVLTCIHSIYTWDSPLILAAAVSSADSIRVIELLRKYHRTFQLLHRAPFSRLVVIVCITVMNFRWWTVRVDNFGKRFLNALSMQTITIKRLGVPLR